MSDHNLTFSVSFWEPVSDYEGWDERRAHPKSPAGSGEAWYKGKTILLSDGQEVLRCFEVQRCRIPEQFLTVTQGKINNNCQAMPKKKKMPKKFLNEVQWQGAEGFKQVKQITTTIYKKKQFRVYKHKMERLVQYKFTKSMWKA